MGNTTFTSMGNLWDGIKNGFSTIGTWAESVGESVSDGVKGLLNFFPRVIDDMNKGIHRNTDGTINWRGSDGVIGYNWDGSPKLQDGYRINPDTRTVERTPNTIEKAQIQSNTTTSNNQSGIRLNFNNNSFGDQISTKASSSTDRYGNASFVQNKAITTI